MKLRNGKTIVETITGYKKAKHNHLIVLKIPSTARHNMDRQNVKDKQFAKHRCSEAIVKEIINLTTGESVNEAYSIHNGNFIYIKGQKVVPDKFDSDLDKVCSGGIHFFLDKQRAGFYTNICLNGEHKEWHDNGQLCIQEFYQDGKLEGEHKEWHDNGQLHVQMFYKDGKLEGELKAWYANGQLHTQTFYKNGKVEGQRNMWYDNGQLHVQMFYKDGKLEGELKAWYANGQLHTQTFYKNGILQIK